MAATVYVYVSPAHDLVRQQHPAHLWVLVLTFIDNGLVDKKTVIVREN